jgi:purine-binding chemotaxis protein CheW
LPLGCILTLADALPVAAVPDPNPAFVGTAFHGAGTIPVLRLDRLLGEAPASAAPAFAIVAHRGAPVALAVSRIGTLVADADPDRLLRIGPLLDGVLPGEASRFVSAPKAAEAEHRERYLVVEIGEETFALPLRDVLRVQGDCRTVAVAAQHLHVGGLANVAGRMLPLLDAAAALGLDRNAGEAAGYVVVANAAGGDFVLPVKPHMRIVAIADSALRPIGKDAPVTALATVADRTVRVLSPPLLARRAGWKRDAA